MSRPPAKLLPKRTSLRGARRLAAGQVLIIGLVAYGLTALLNAGTLVKMAERQRLGSWQRGLYMNLTKPIRSLSEGLHLDGFHRAIDDYRNPLASSASTAPPTTTPSSSVPTSVPSTSPGSSVPVGSTVPTTATTPTTTGGQRVPTAADPLRLWIGGDSEAQGLGQALEAVTSQTGKIDATLEYRVSSGLSRPDYFDWPARLAQIVAASKAPEVLVVVFGGNDAQPLQLADGKVYDVTDKQWQDEYRRRVDAVMSLLTQGGRKIVWVGPPNAKSAKFTGRLAILSQIYADESAKHAGSVFFLDSRPLFSDASGNYSAYLPDSSGNPVNMRLQDGFHLSIAGSHRLARAVYQQIQAFVPSLT